MLGGCIRSAASTTLVNKNNDFCQTRTRQLTWKYFSSQHRSAAEMVSPKTCQWTPTCIQSIMTMPWIELALTTSYNMSHSCQILAHNVRTSYIPLTTSRFTLCTWIPQITITVHMTCPAPFTFVPWLSIGHSYWLGNINMYIYIYGCVYFGRW